MFEMKNEGEDMILVRYNGSEESVTIPEHVTIIGKDAFKKCKIKTVYIPKRVRCIEDGAFLGCRALTSIVFLEKHCHVSIGHKSFYGCSSLTEPTLPYGVVYCNDSFARCKRLKCIRQAPPPVRYS